jgi:hypothetical protein
MVSLFQGNMKYKVCTGNHRYETRKSREFGSNVLCSITDGNRSATAPGEANYTLRLHRDCSTYRFHFAPLLKFESQE